MDNAQLLALVASHRWLALIAFVVGFLARLSKTDNRFFVNLPARARPWAVLALSVVACVLERRLAGSSWADGLVSGLLVAGTTVFGHQLLVESLLKGKELPLGPLMNKGDDAGPKDPPAGGGLGGVAALCVAFLLGPALSGCAGTFEEARVVGLKAHPASAATEHRDDARCKELDDARISAGANAKGLGVVAGVSGGGGGLVDAVFGAPKWALVLTAVASVVAGGAAVQQFVTAEGKGASWARECSGGAP